jgi:hypothetical protein
MFVVLAQPRTRRSCPDLPAIRVLGDVDYGRIATFAHLDGQRVTCTSGRLWLTVENDPTDYVLRPRERMIIAGAGKVVIGGRGSYAI